MSMGRQAILIFLFEGLLLLPGLFDVGFPVIQICTHCRGKLFSLLRIVKGEHLIGDQPIDHGHNVGDLMGPPAVPAMTENVDQLAIEQLTDRRSVATPSGTTPLGVRSEPWPSPGPDPASWTGLRL